MTSVLAGAIALVGCGGARPSFDTSPATPAAAAPFASGPAARAASGGADDGAGLPAAVLSAKVEEVVDARGETSSAGRYVPVAPTRVLDTRSGIGWARQVGVGEQFDLAVGGIGPVPASGVIALVLNVTATNASGAGFITTWPAGGSRPDVSSLNVERRGQTIPNLVTVRAGAGGAVSFYASNAMDLIADVEGYYVGAASSSPGRLVARTPYRLLDTRISGGAKFGVLDGGERVTIDARAAGAPADALAAVLNVTATGPTRPGYWTVMAASDPLPDASNLNIERANQTIANQVIAPLSGGQFAVFSQTGGHLIVDIAGWYTGASATSGVDGMFVPVEPTRVLDTRRASDSPTGGQPTSPGQELTGSLTTLGLPADGASALALNLTITQARGPGYVTVAPAGQPMPTASNLNVGAAGQTIANHAITPVSTVGFNVFSQSGGHLIADVTGYFTNPIGGAKKSTDPPPTNPPTNPPGQPSSPPSAGAHAFLYSFGDGTFARWNPCAAIRYSVNYTHAPSGARAALADAFAKVVAATGLTFEDVGDTTEGLDGVPPANADAVIAFANAAESGGKLSSGGVLGVGGGSFVSFPSKRVIAGYVVLNRDYAFPEGYGDNSLGETLLHEIGHMVGLAHVSDVRQVMYPTSHAVTGWGDGDREGLWNLGAAQGCLEA